MNLRNNQITVGEVLKNPNARQLLQKEIPRLMNHPMLPMSYSIPLRDILTYADKNIYGYMPKNKIKFIISQLEKL